MSVLLSGLARFNLFALIHCSSIRSVNGIQGATEQSSHAFFVTSLLYCWTAILLLSSLISYIHLDTRIANTAHLEHPVLSRSLFLPSPLFASSPRLLHPLSCVCVWGSRHTPRYALTVSALASAFACALQTEGQWKLLFPVNSGTTETP